MSNSSRIEVATRQHVNATLTNDQIVELVKASDPNWKGGVYPSDVAYSQTPEGLKPRGATAYGDGILIYLGANSFKVLPTDQIVRRPQSKRPVAKAAEPAVAPAVAAVVEGPTEKKAVVKKAAGSTSQPPVAPKQKATSARV